MIGFDQQTIVSLKNYLRHLNLFEPSIDSSQTVDEQRRRSNIIATRIYLVILVLTLVSFGIFTWLDPQIIIVALEYPSEDQFKNVPLDAHCLCSRISVSYGEFTMLYPSFHQVCSSDFVSDRWIKAISTGSNSTYFSVDDFRKFGSAQFQALAGFCRLSIANVQLSIASFHQNTFISSQVFSETALQVQMQSTIDQFRRTAPKAFAAQLELIRRVTASNKLVSGLQTNYIFIYGNDHSGIGSATYRRSNGTLCDCVSDFQCASDAVFYDTFGASTELVYDKTKVLLGISSGCLPVSTILSSTLECFYNQTCVDDLISFFPSLETFSAMTIANQSRFESRATVQSMVDELMVEDWIKEISYQKYYNQCAPSSCTYSKEKRHELLFVMTKVIGILSGLTLVLELVIPVIVRFVIKKLKREQSPKIAICVRLHQLKANLKQIIVNLNLFKRHPSNDRQIRYQRYATRLYVLLIIISVGILTQYNLINTTVRRQTVLHPSESQYHELETVYSASLSCPCTTISIPYSTFITIKAQYHQLCSSYLISSQWIIYSYSGADYVWYILDYRALASSQFQTLAMLCKQARQTIDDALSIFLRIQTVSSQVISQRLLQSQMNALIHDWKSTTISQFVRTIELIRVTTLTNQLMNRLNIYFHTNTTTSKITIEPRSYDGCNCAFFGTCHTSMSIFSYDLLTSAPYEVYSIPNFFVGCYLIDVLFLSTLECFYNQSCMIGLDQYLNSSLRGSLSFPALDSSLNPPDETIKSIVDRLMVVLWTSNVAFSSYYQVCAPSSCTVEYRGRNGIFTVITIVIGICGGLSIGFKMLILLGLRLIEKCMNNFSCTVSIHAIKRLFSCSSEEQMTHRLHLALVVATLCILYIFCSFSPQLVVIELKKPSFEDYETLATQYPISLRCPCSEISIQYQLFLTITASFHPMCSRDFIGELWLKAALTAHNGFYENVSINYVYSATGQLQALSSLCQLSQDIVQDSLLQLLSSHLINIQMISHSVLSKRVQTTINDYRIIMPKLFINTFSLTRETTEANKLMTTFNSNWMFTASPNLTNGCTINTIPVSYEECNCALSAKCATVLYGVMLGCYILEAHLQSTLECLYDQECIDKTHTYLPLNSSVNPSRFDINSTVESILNELMIEELRTSLSYTNYFAQCAPSSCVYSYTEKNNSVEGITVLISLYGGLVIICRLVALAIVKVLRYRSARVSSTTNE